MALCFYYRMRLILEEDQGRLPRHVARHLEHCRACALLRHLENRIGGELAETTKIISCEPSPFLKSRIKSGLRDLQKGDPDLVFEPSRSWLHLTTGIAALLLAGSALWSYLTPNQSELNQSSHHVQSSPVAGESINKEETLPHLLPTEPQIKEWVAQIDQPLAQELESVMGDAKAAVSLLTFNFIPDKSRDASPKERSAN